MVSAPRSVLRVCLALALGGTCGCGLVERSYWRETLTELPENPPRVQLSGQIQNPDWGGAVAVLRGADLHVRGHAVTDDRGHVIRVPAGREELGEELGQLIGDALDEVYAELGFRPRYHGEFCVLEMQVRPSIVHVESVGTAQDTVAVPLFMEPGQSAGHVLNDNNVMLGIYLHEFVEGTLMDPASHPRVLPDGTMRWSIWGWNWWSWESVNRTRWLRDGLSNYAAVLFRRALDRRVHERAPDVERSSELTAVFGSVSALSRLGPELFDWAQTEDQELSMRHYYPAACGLFSLLAEWRGGATLREFVARLEGLDYPDGDALEDLFEEIYGVTPEQFVERLNFDPGLSAAGWPSWNPTLAVRPDSPAAAWGFRDGDRVTSVAGDGLADFITLELALLRAASDQQSLQVVVQRDGEPVTLEFAPGPVLSGSVP